MDFRESGTGLGFIHASGFRRINFLLLFCGGGYKEYLQTHKDIYPSKNEQILMLNAKPVINI